MYEVEHKPKKATFLNVSPELHQAVKAEAESRGMTLSDAYSEGMTEWLKRSKVKARSFGRLEKIMTGLYNFLVSQGDSKEHANICRVLRVIGRDWYSGNPGRG